MLNSDLFNFFYCHLVLPPVSDKSLITEVIMSPIIWLDFQVQGTIIVVQAPQRRWKSRVHVFKLKGGCRAIIRVLK